MATLSKEASQTKIEVFSTGQGYVVLRCRNGRHTLDAVLGYDTVRQLCGAMHLTAQQELFKFLAKKGSHVGKLC